MPDAIPESFVIAHVMDAGPPPPDPIQVVVRQPPFDIRHFDKHLPEIERRIRELKPHAIVCGLGPSAYLLPLLPPEVLAGVRIWGVNDFWRVMPCHELILMDWAHIELAEGTTRYDWILKSKPERFWIYENRNKHTGETLPDHWRKRIPALKTTPVKTFDLVKWHPSNGFKADKGGKPTPPMLQGRPFHHAMMSPVGTLAIAWAEGFRRIGLIGVDLIPGHHRLSDEWQKLDWFLGHFGTQAKELNGTILNLSPFSSIKSLQPCPPSTSG